MQQYDSFQQYSSAFVLNCVPQFVTHLTRNKYYLLSCRHLDNILLLAFVNIYIYICETIILLAVGCTLNFLLIGDWMFPFHTPCVWTVEVCPCFIHSDDNSKKSFIFIAIQKMLAHIQPLHFCVLLGNHLAQSPPPPKKAQSVIISHMGHSVICHFINSHPSVIQKYSTDTLVDVFGYPCITYATVFETVNPVINILLG
jgi:hypothetical protein